MSEPTAASARAACGFTRAINAVPACGLEPSGWTTAQFAPRPSLLTTRQERRRHRRRNALQRRCTTSVDGSRRRPTGGHPGCRAPRLSSTRPKSAAFSIAEVRIAAAIAAGTTNGQPPVAVPLRGVRVRRRTARLCGPVCTSTIRRCRGVSLGESLPLPATPVILCLQSCRRPKPGRQVPRQHLTPTRRSGQVDVLTFK